ncbi:ATP-binding protein [Actinomadura scrupuli]|uniref:nSTAND1 domain-containing NTPase n=1 Tax=Actinomadura scrupuli TaxID=559629 RepID=UPI003D974BF0
MTHVDQESRPSPYVGARPFDLDDRELFFGRADESRELAGLWQRNRFTILHGHAGVGKTSLLQAGAVPRLLSAPVHILPVGRAVRRSTFPMAALPEQNPYTFALLSSWSPGESPIRLSGLSINEFLRRQECGGRDGEPLLVAIDHGERIFRTSGVHDHKRRRFIEELLEALASRPRTHLLVAVREDQLEAVLPVAERFEDGSFARFPLGPLERGSAIEAVRRPLTGTGRCFGPGAAERLVDELRGSGTAKSHGADRTDTVDPALLQMTCARLWAKLPAGTGTVLPQPAVEVDDALAESCALALAAVAAGHGRRPRDLESWLRGTFVTQQGGARILEGPQQTFGLGNSVVRAMEDEHLIKSRQEHGRRWYELQHPRLVRPIRRLRKQRRPIRRPDPSARLRVAELALSEGEFGLALLHAEGAARLCGRDDMRIRAEAESFLGNIAHEQRMPEAAVAHYRAAAGMFEMVQDPAAVGRLLTAVGRLKCAEEDGAVEAVEELRAGAGRAPNDLTVQTGLGQALWYAGQPQAALAVLNGVLHRDGDTAEALRARGEILADMGDAGSALRDLDRLDRRIQPSTRAARALALATWGRIEEARRELADLAVDAEDTTDDGPVLFRVARVQELSGDPAAAARSTALALAASHPPLPKHQRAAAERLLDELGR